LNGNPLWSVNGEECGDDLIRCVVQDKMNCEEQVRLQFSLETLLLFTLSEQTQTYCSFFPHPPAHSLYTTYLLFYRPKIPHLPHNLDTPRQNYGGASHWAEVELSMTANTQANSSACLRMGFCKPLGGFNVWAAMPPLPFNKTSG